MPKQTTLFSHKNNKKKRDPTDADVAYSALARDGFAQKYHIYSAQKCYSLLVWKLNHKSIILDQSRKIHQMLSTLTNGCYYHLDLGHLKLYPYTAWIMKMVDKSLKSEDDTNAKSASAVSSDVRNAKKSNN